jgi:glutathione S-transferase
VITLYLFAGSAAALTTQLELEYKGLEYEAVYVPPVAHKAILARRGFEGMSVPALELDGRRVDGTRAISRELDALRPEPSLRTGDAAVAEAERWGEELQDAARRIFYLALRRRPWAWARAVAQGQRPAVRAALLAGAPALVQVAGIYHGGVAKRAGRDLEELPARLARIDEWLDAGLLGGPQPNAADFEIAPNVRLLLAFADLAPVLERTRAAQHARRIVPEFPFRFPRAGLRVQPPSASSSRR